MTQPTNKNHYLPCFWTALWNTEYYFEAISGLQALLPRKRFVNVLNLKSNTIYKSKTEKIFYVEGLGHIPLTYKEYLELSSFGEMTSEHIDVNEEGTYILDFENHFTTLEDAVDYNYIFSFIKRNGRIDDMQAKIKMSVILFYHNYRSRRYIESLFDKYSDCDNLRLEAYYEWKYLMDKISITLQILKFLDSKWTVYSLEYSDLPLCDNPFINDENEIIAIISPRHLIKIELTKRSNSITYKSNFKCLEYKKIIKKIIDNTDSVIVSADVDLLEKIKMSKSWLRKVEQHA